MQIPEWAGFLVELVGLGVGLLFLIFPHRVIRYLARVVSTYYRGLVASDKQVNNRLELPGARYFQEGMTNSEFIQLAERDPRKLTRLSGCIMLFGAGVVLLFGGSLVVVLLLKTTGFIQ
jgi:hypothetical protein